MGAVALWVHITGGDTGYAALPCSTRESILRARDGDNILIQYGTLLSIMEADF